MNRNYNKSPHFALPVMADSPVLQDYTDVIESALCRLDVDHYENISDKQAFRLMEILLDKYFFGDLTISFENKLEQEGFELIDQAIKENLGELSSYQVSELLGTIYRSIRRRDLKDRDYMEFIKRHVGIRIGKGIRAIPNFLIDES